MTRPSKGPADDDLQSHYTLLSMPDGVEGGRGPALGEYQSTLDTLQEW